MANKIIELAKKIIELAEEEETSIIDKIDTTPALKIKPNTWRL